MKPQEMAALVNGSRVVQISGVETSHVSLALPDPAVARAVTLADGRIVAEAPSPFRMNERRWLLAAALLAIGLGCGSALTNILGR